MGDPRERSVQHGLVDPFAGLVAPETFTGIDRGGFVEKK